MIVGFANMLLAPGRTRSRGRSSSASTPSASPTYRNELLPEYQSGRDFPPVLTSQLDRLPELVGLARLPVGEGRRLRGGRLPRRRRRRGGGARRRGARPHERPRPLPARQPADDDPPAAARPAGARAGRPRRGEGDLRRPARARPRLRRAARRPLRPNPGRQGHRAGRAASILAKHGSLEACLAAGGFPDQADALRDYLRMARLQADAPIPGPSRRRPRLGRRRRPRRGWGLAGVARASASGPADPTTILRVSEPKPINVADYERLAEACCEPGYWGYVVGGAGDEVTLRDNLEAFRRRVLRPRMLVDVSDVSTATSVLGTEIALPLMIAPTSLQRVAHPDGEPALARAAAAVGTVYTLSEPRERTPARAGRRRRRRRPALVPALLVARPRVHDRAGRGGRRRGLRGARPDRRPSRGRAARARPPQRLQPPDRPPHAEPPRALVGDRALPRHPRRDRGHEPHLARPRVAAGAVLPAARGQGRPHRRGRGARLRARLRRHRRLQPRRAPARRRRRDAGRAPRGRRGRRRPRRGLPRRRRSPGHRRGQGARARRAVGARRPAGALGARRGRRGRRAPRARASPGRGRARAPPPRLPDARGRGPQHVRARA